jgi:hypothetical protein
VEELGRSEPRAARLNSEIGGRAEGKSAKWTS